jgi:hypothetical protein
MTAIDRLQRDVDDLIVAYAEGHVRGRGLLYQLEDIPSRTLASVERSEGKAGKPGSKPPMPLDAVDLAMKIKRGAQDLCHELGAGHLLGGYDSLRRLPALCERVDDDKLHEVCSRVGGWRSTARTILGYQEPAVHYEQACCPFCGLCNVYARPEQVRAWCKTEDCMDPQTGQSPQFTRVSLLALIQEAS